MKTGIFCIWCGSELEYNDDHTVCLCCRTLFTDISFSRTPSDDGENMEDEIDVLLESLSIVSKA